MNHIGTIQIRPLIELIGGDDANSIDIKDPEIKSEAIEDCLETSLKTEKQLNETPKKIRKRTKAATTSKKQNRIEGAAAAAAEKITKTKTEIKKPRSSQKEPLPGQLRIDTFYKSASKTYTIPPPPKIDRTATKLICNKSLKKPKRRRKALFPDDDSTTTTVSDENYVDVRRKRKPNKVQTFVDLCSDSEGAEEEPSSATTNDDGAAMKMISSAAERNVRRTSLTISLPTIEEAAAMQENIAAAAIMNEAITPPKSSKDSLLDDLNENSLLTPMICRKRNDSPWLEEESFKKSRLTDAYTKKIAENRSTSPPVPNKNNRIKTRSGAKKLKNQETEEDAVPKSGKSEKTRKRNSKEPLQPPPSRNIDDTNVAKSPKGTIPVITSSYTLKTPNVHETKQDSTKPPPSTPNDANLKEKKKVTVPTVQSSSSFMLDIVTLSDDEEQENIYIPKTAIKSKAKTQKLAIAIPKTEPKKRTKVPRPCPPYKVVEGTTFAVDAFQFGDIQGVTHYFLTHFHADHYIGLNKKFSHPLYVSPITARLLNVFIPIDEEFLREITLNTPIIINDIEVTAIDANHCPGAVMLIFKTREGKCLLHTGDFRACAEMESEPIFWNNDIHTIYLDTTYFPRKYAFSAQSESIDRALHIMEEFHEKNVGTRTLYVCGSYLIGKEKFWSAIAHKMSLKVWVDTNRRKALNAVNDENIIPLLVEDPCEAHMHIIPMVHLSYPMLVEYIDKYSQHFDILFALRPSGWEKDTKPQFRGKVNIVGIEYSEHSSHDELKRFVQYLKPKKVISTVPVGRDLMKTAKIPDNWYKYDTLAGLKQSFQPAITSYFTTKKSLSKTIVTTTATAAATAAASSPVADLKLDFKISEHEMVLSPLEKCEFKISQEEEMAKCEKKNILEIEEVDDWLT